MTDETQKLLDHNLALCDQLDPKVIGIAKEAVSEAFQKNMTFKILETRRTYARQCLLLSQGRTKNDIMRNDFLYGFRLNQQQMKDMLAIYDQKKNLQGPIVTYTLNSEHLLGLAMDIEPKNTTYAELSLFFITWNILENIPFDKPHFSFSQARMPIRTSVKPEERLKSLERRKEITKDPIQKGMISNLIHRLSVRLGLQ